MATQNKKYLDDHGLSTVAGYIKERLRTVSAMPASAGNGTVVLYTGTTSGSYINGHIYQYATGTSTWNDISGSSSVSILPTPAANLTESDIVTAANAATGTSSNAPSLFGIQQWTNVKNKVIEYNGTVGSTGIGTWQEIEDLLETPPSASDCASWGWWYDDYFKNAELDTANVKIDFSYEGDEELSIGAWYLNTDVGYLEVQFGNELSDPSNMTIYVEFEITRNSIS